MLRVIPKLRQNFFAQIRRCSVSIEKEEVYRELPPFDSHANLRKVVPIFKKATIYLERIALKDTHGKYSYLSLAKGTQPVEQLISNALKGKTGERVVFLCPNDANYVLVQWAIWMSGQIAVPLSPLHPPEMMEYYIKDSQANLLVTTPRFAELMDAVAQRTDKKLLVIDDSIRRDAITTSEMTPNLPNLGQPDEFYQNDREALIIYTSGTTGNPKGVVLSHKNLQAQMLALIKAWKWTYEDSILHTLPLHHVHGIVNVLMCPLYVGARCTMLPKFDANEVWTQLLGINLRPDDRINVYMGVPTIYVKLMQEYEKIFRTNPKMVEYVLQTLKQKVRLMVSGSAPLPRPVFNKWLDISGHRLLERYGMTETGMMLSNLYDEKSVQILYELGQKQEKVVSNVCDMSEKKSAVNSGEGNLFKSDVRVPGYVGVPLPGVEIRLAEKLEGNKYRTILECNGGNLEEPLVVFSYFDEKTSQAIESNADEADYPTGEILAKGPSLFKLYYNRPTETAIEFTEDGWFRTGDIGLYDPKVKLFKILGRNSVDIIKSGGYKISSLHIETVMLEHPEIKECAVVALPDLTYGEKVAAVVVLQDETATSLPGLTEWNRIKLSEYSVPKVVRFISEMPRNAMGKVNKKELVKEVFGDVLKDVEERSKKV